MQSNKQNDNKKEYLKKIFDKYVVWESIFHEMNIWSALPSDIPNVYKSFHYLQR